MVVVVVVVSKTEHGWVVDGRHLPNTLIGRESSWLLVIRLRNAATIVGQVPGLTFTSTGGKGGKGRDDSRPSHGEQRVMR